MFYAELRVVARTVKVEEVLFPCVFESCIAQTASLVEVVPALRGPAKNVTKECPARTKAVVVSQLGFQTAHWD